jgi:hypothetical protein
LLFFEVSPLVLSRCLVHFLFISSWGLVISSCSSFDAHVALPRCRCFASFLPIPPFLAPLETGAIVSTDRRTWGRFPLPVAGPQREGSENSITLVAGSRLLFITYGVCSSWTSCQHSMLTAESWGHDFTGNVKAWTTRPISQYGDGSSRSFSCCHLHNVSVEW